MGTTVLTNAFVSVNGVDLSDHVKNVSINFSVDDIDDTNMGDTTRVHKAGLKDWSVDIEFAQDFAAGEVDATLWPLVGTEVTVVVRNDTGSVSSTNPSYSGTAVLMSYPPISGSVGDLHTTTASFQAAGDLSRSIS
jgi:hypothetical protein